MLTLVANFSLSLGFLSQRSNFYGYVYIGVEQEMCLQLSGLMAWLEQGLTLVRITSVLPSVYNKRNK